MLYSMEPHGDTLTNTVCRFGNDIRLKRAATAALPTFDCVLEVLGHGKCRLHPDTAASTNALLTNTVADTQLRSQRDGKLLARFEQGSGGNEAGNGTVADWLSTLASCAQSKALPTVTAKISNETM